MNIAKDFMKHGSTLFLKAAVWFMGMAVLAICGLLILPVLLANEGGYYSPILILMCVSAVPFLFALYKTLGLLGYIDKNIAFSVLSINALKHIKYCALIIAVLYSASMPYVYYAAQRDDAPGVIVIGLIVAFGSLVIAGFAAVLQLLLKNAIEIKSENDLTV